jgi:hypothetical protein
MDQADEPNPEIMEIERRHPRWKIGRTESGLCFEAVAHPTERSIHVVVSTSLRELGERLDAVEPYEPRN